MIAHVHELDRQQSAATIAAADKAMLAEHVEEQAQQDAALSASIDALLRRVLTSEARARIARIALVEPARADTIKANLVQMYQGGEFQAPLSDASLKQMLTQQSKSRSNASIRRI